MTGDCFSRQRRKCGHGASPACPTKRADLAIALGSTLSVYPAASFPLMTAQRGVPYVVINRGATDHDHEAAVSLRIDGDVAEIFPAAVDAALND